MKPSELFEALHAHIGITAALGRLHQRGLFHRDIKPANVFVNTSTGGYPPRIDAKCEISFCKAT